LTFIVPLTVKMLGDEDVDGAVEVVPSKRSRSGPVALPSPKPIPPAASAVTMNPTASQGDRRRG